MSTSTTTSTTTVTPRISLDLEDGLWYESDGSVGPLQLPDDLSPPGLLVEEGVHGPVLAVDHVEGARHLLVGGGEEDLARDELGSCT